MEDENEGIEKSGEDIRDGKDCVKREQRTGQEKYGKEGLEIVHEEKGQETRSLGKSKNEESWKRNESEKKRCPEEGERRAVG